METRRNLSNVKTVRKWKTEADAEDILFSLTTQDMIGEMHIHKKIIDFGKYRLRQFVYIM